MNTLRLLTIILAILISTSNRVVYSAPSDAEVVGEWLGTWTKSGDPTDVGTSFRITFNRDTYACIQTRGKEIVNSWAGHYSVEASQIKLTYKDGTWSAVGILSGNSLVLQTTGGSENHGTIELHKQK